MLKKYLSLVKFAHTLFALPFALVGLSWGVEWLEIRQLQPDKPWWQLLLLVLACMVTARNAAMAFNRYTDRHIDAKNARTAMREIPAGVVNERQALAFIGINVALFIVFSGLINQLCLLLSPVALAVILGYSYTKRFTALCHFVLGLGLSLAPVGAFLAVSGQFSPEPVILGLVVLCWVSGFDIIYALQDDEFDREQQLHSVPAALGRTRALQLSSLLHVACAGAMVYFGQAVNGTWLMWMGICVFLGLLLYQHLIVKAHDLSRVNLAFFTTNGIASVLFATCYLADAHLLR